MRDLLAISRAVARITHSFDIHKRLYPLVSNLLGSRLL